jgi:hypothetical protein
MSLIGVGLTLLPHIGGFLGAIISKNNIKSFYEPL